MSALAPSAESVTAEDPTGVATALGVPALRIELLRHLRAGPSTISQLATALGCTRNGLQPHIDLLESLGAISHSTERVRGIYRPTRRYQVNPVRLETLAWCFFDALTAYDTEDSV